MVIAVYLLGIISFTSLAQTSDSSKIDESIKNFLQADNQAKDKAANKIIKLNPDFSIVYSRLKQGKQYSDEVKKGFFEHNYKNEVGIEHPNLVFIPFNYNPNLKYKVRINLHGAVSGFDARRWVNTINRENPSWRSVNSINLFPAGSFFSEWWKYSQYENISKLIDYIKINYNVDENNISISGTSDGATGIYYLSNFYQTPFSCLVPTIGSMRMLTMIDKKQFYMKNYQNLSFFIVNGRKDEIFDINFVEATITELKKHAKEVNFFVNDTLKHNMSWRPLFQDSINKFIASHPRNPFPDKLYYATEKPDTFNRKYWVRIDHIEKINNGIIEDPNMVKINNQTFQLFSRDKVFGQIDVQKNDNTVRVKTQNVKEYTLLISPDHFDLNKPIVVYTNDMLSFNKIIPPSLKTLLKYYSEDNDRSMLFSSELSIKVGKEYTE